MAVLIAIEIFINIVSYLRENVIHIKIVLATSFMAVALEARLKGEHPCEAMDLWTVAPAAHRALAVDN